MMVTKTVIIVLSLINLNAAIKTTPKEIINSIRNTKHNKNYNELKILSVQNYANYRQ